MANQINLEYKLGETWFIDFDLNDQNLEDIDLSGAVVEFTMYIDGVNDLLLASNDSPSAISIDSPTIGTGSVVITPLDQLNMFPGIFPYEIQAVLADNSVTTQIFGKITVLASLFTSVST